IGALRNEPSPPGIRRPGHAPQNVISAPIRAIRGGRIALIAPYVELDTYRIVVAVLTLKTLNTSKVSDRRRSAPKRSDLAARTFTTCWSGSRCAPNGSSGIVTLVAFGTLRN